MPNPPPPRPSAPAEQRRRAVARTREALIRRAYRAFAERDLETLVSLASPQIEVSTVTGLLAGREEPYRGHEGIAEYLRDTEGVWKRLELFPREFHALDDERMMVFGRVRAWHERGFLDSANAWLWTVGEGKVTAVQVFANPGDARTFLRGEASDP